MSTLNFLKISPMLLENMRVAIEAVKSNKLRSTLTVIIIAIGITSLVGVLTAVDAIKNELNNAFESIGAKNITITEDYYSIRKAKERRIRNNSEITYQQANLFKKNFKEKNTIVSYRFGINTDGIIHYNSTKSTPTFSYIAADIDYNKLFQLSIKEGRWFNQDDYDKSLSYCVIGTNATSIFKNGESPINKILTINGARYKIIGVLDKFGNNMISGGIDNCIILPYTSARVNLASSSSSFIIEISPKSKDADVDNIYNNANTLMRNIRRLSPTDKNDFNMSRMDKELEELYNILALATLISIIIGIITILGAATGLMNIMLVSVKERRNEIGTRKAIGASSKMIKEQFLIESIYISQIGCIIGIVVGLTAGNIVAMSQDVPFYIPWSWLFIAICICFIVGISSGYIPALRASKLDPIETLRNE